jgi:hypothetical protein
MAYRLTDQAKRYFRSLLESGDNKLDMMEVYYYCCVVGLLKKDRSSNNNGEIFLQTIYSKFSANNSYRYHELLLLLLNSEIKHVGINPSNRTELKKLCSELFISNDDLKLTELGMKRLNDYCESGFQELYRRGIHTVSAFDFLYDWHQIIKNLEYQY